MNLIDWWINWFEDWFTYDKVLFFAGVFIGFLFFCCFLFLDEWITARRYKKKIRKDENNEL